MLTMSESTMRRTISQIASTVDVEGLPVTPKAVFVQGKLRGYQGCIPCDHCTIAPDLAYLRAARYER
jgi:hypothetical protein